MGGKGKEAVAKPKEEEGVLFNLHVYQISYVDKNGETQHFVVRCVNQLNFEGKKLDKKKEAEVTGEALERAVHSSNQNFSVLPNTETYADITYVKLEKSNDQNRKDRVTTPYKIAQIKPPKPVERGEASITAKKEERPPKLEELAANDIINLWKGASSIAITYVGSTKIPEDKLQNPAPVENVADAFTGKPKPMLKKA